MSANVTTTNSGNYFQKLIENSFDSIILLDQNGFILYASPSVTRLTGFSQEELINQTFFTSIHPLDRDLATDFLQKSNTSTDPLKFEIRIIDKAGFTHWIEVVTTPLINDPEIRGIIINFHDITRFKSNEQELGKFQLAVEDALDHIIITDPKGIIIYANAAAEKTTGYKKSEMIGQTPALWGKQMPAEFYSELWKKIKTEKSKFEGEIINRHKNGSQYYAEIKISPVLNKKEEILFYVGLERNITKAKEVDRMKTEFISLASHQLRTPLTAVKWLTETLQGNDLGHLNTEQFKYVNNIYKANFRMIELVNDLLNISRIETGKIVLDPQPTNLNKLIQDILEDFDNRVKDKKLKTIVSIHPSLPVLHIDPKLISQVIINLISNAIKYTPESGEIHIIVSENGNSVTVQVSDNGYGIPENQQKRVFEKFFRGDNIISKETDGTGLGLYLAKAIIESSSGKIWFTSEVDKGTSFFFSLPIGSN